MISYLPMGRMGNALFQSAATIALALRNDVEYSMPINTSSSLWSPVYLVHLRNENWVQGRADIKIVEKNFHYVPLPYKSEWDDKQVLLEGYFQTEKHFLDFKKEIIELFDFPWELNKDFVSVHLRRTDFIVLKEKHPEVTDEWYNEAMSKFTNKKFLFFSDEIEYCKRTWGYRSDCFFSEGQSIEQDLIDMSCCIHHVNSSSTYSWWGSYLGRNEDKIIITPKAWFTPNWDGADTKDLIPETWIKL